MKVNKNLYTKYISLEITMIQFGLIQLSTRRCYFVFTEIVVVVPSRIVLHGIVQHFACNIRILRDNIDIMFDGAA